MTTRSRTTLAAGCCAVAFVVFAVTVVVVVGADGSDSRELSRHDDAAAAATTRMERAGVLHSEPRVTTATATATATAQAPLTLIVNRKLDAEGRLVSYSAIELTADSMRRHADELAHEVWNKLSREFTGKPAQQRW